MKTLHLVLFCLIIVYASTGAPAVQVLQKGDAIFWGDATNCLRAGLECGEDGISIDARTSKTLSPSGFAFGTLSSNRVLAYWPRTGKQFMLALSNSNGLPVPRTSLGKTISAIKDADMVLSPKQWHRKNYSITPLYPNELFTPNELHLPDYFILTNSGTYELRMSVQTFLTETNGALKSVILPAVTVPVHVR